MSQTSVCDLPAITEAETGEGKAAQVSQTSVCDLLAIIEVEVGEAPQVAQGN